MHENSEFPRKIWMYWENKPFTKKPAYLDLCCDTIERHRGDFELLILDDRTVRDYLDIPDKVWKLEEIAHRADYIRFKLLESYGGVWLDADVVLVRNIEDALFPYIEQFDFVGYGREQGKPSINFLACRTNCKIIEQQSAAISEVLEKKEMGRFQRKLKLVWTEIGHDLLWDLAADYPYHHHELGMVAPIFWKDWRLFFDRELELQPYLDHDPYAFMLYNDFMFQKLKNKSRKDLLEDDTLLSKLLRYALSDC